jgi:hypothetical protein
MSKTLINRKFVVKKYDKKKYRTYALTNNMIYVFKIESL